MLLIKYFLIYGPLGYFHRLQLPIPAYHFAAFPHRQKQSLLRERLLLMPLQRLLEFLIFPVEYSAFSYA